MKTMKKLASLLLALAMIFALATTAFAEGDDDENTPPTKNDSITITSAKAGETYELYKLFDLVVDNEYSPTGFSYKVNSAWANFFAADGAGAQYITLSGTNVIDISDPAALAKAAAEWAGKPETAVKTVTVGENATTAEFTGLPNGYWLITSSLGTVAMTETTPANSAVTIKEKNPTDTITKEVLEDSNTKWGDKNDAQIGDTVNFMSTATLQPHTTKVKIHDTMDEGLTYNKDVKIFTDAACSNELTTTNYTIQAQPDEGDTFTIVFTEAYLATITSETKLYLKYSAVLNEKAITIETTTSGEGDNKTTTTTAKVDDQLNKTTITYGDAQSAEDSTTTTTHKFSVFKHATDSTDNLAGAIFQLKKGTTVVNLVKIDDNNYRVANGNEKDITEVDSFTTVAKGDIIIWGVDSDSDYTLVEMTAPTGYNQLKDAVSVTVNADNSTRVDVENKFGAELPSTGGMGTTLFYIVGGIMVAAAAVLLVTKKRMAN